VTAAEPLAELRGWIEQARGQGLSHPAAATFATADGEGRPSARTVTVKRVLDDSLVFTSALWTRKARDITANPHVSVLFFWPEMGRQVHVAGTVEIGDRALAEELYGERDTPNQLQAIVSRQGEPIEAEDLELMRDRLGHLAEVQEAPPRCPEDWGALIVSPGAVELWSEAPDRLHERRLFTRGADGWEMQLISP
jgi:pyridoxamine 5'-phosphate oxidase